jgi:uncharacterized metal-binding protein YceD (DUF177 family)
MAMKRPIKGSITASAIATVMKQASRSLRQLRFMAEETARGGRTVRQMQAYKNAVATEDDLLIAIKNIL